MISQNSSVTHFRVDPPEKAWVWPVATASSSFSTLVGKSISLMHRSTFPEPQKGLETRRKYTVYSCTHSNVHTFLPYCILNTSFTHTVVLKICVLCACARAHWPDSRAAHRSLLAHHAVRYLYVLASGKRIRLYRETLGLVVTDRARPGSGP